MNDLVRPCQNAFIKGRAIHDNYSYVSGLAKAFRKSKTPALMIKLDIQKAFDTVSWEFLLKLLEFRGFGRKVTDCIVTLLSSATTRVLVNGELSDTIKLQKGLRQGDPLSPLLFVIVMDCLAAIFNKAVELGILGPIGVQNIPFRTSLYADDAVLFIAPCNREVQAVRQILELFREATGLRTNISKSSVTPICCEGIDLQELLHGFDCPTHEFPCTYLGMPLSDKKLKRGELQPICDKVMARMKGWKLALMSLDGRIDLVKTVLSAMPIFQMIALHMPA